MLKNYRKEIDKIDFEIIKLLSERLKISLRVGALKKSNGTEIVDLDRENEIFNRLFKEGKKLGLNEDYIKKVFGVIIGDSKKRQGI